MTAWALTEEVKERRNIGTMNDLGEHLDKKIIENGMMGPAG